MFVQRGYRHPGIEQRGDYLPHAVIPGVSRVVHEDGIGFDVGALFVKIQRRCRFEIGVLDNEELIIAPVVKAPQYGVALPDEQSPARPQQIGNSLRPKSDVG